LTTIQKTTCEKCLKDLHDECLDSDKCLCAENRHGEPLFKVTDEVKRLFTVEKAKKSGREITKAETGDIKTHTDCGEFIMTKCKFITLKDTNEIYFYQDGIWCEGGKFLIEELCQEIINECKNSFTSEVIGMIHRSTGINHDELNNNLSKFVLENGVLDLDTLVLTEHNPELLSTIKLPTEYDPKARCPKFIKFLKDCLNPHDVITVIEECANILTLNRNYRDVCAIWIGDGANGKSTLLKIIEGLFGSNNCSAVSLHAMQGESFALADLEGKPINIYADISNRELNNLGKFKQIISQESLRAEKKNQPSFKFRPFAKLFFSANEMPDIKDNSDGVFRRIYVTKWENQFLPGINRIDNLDRIILKEEKSGIFNLLIQNYRTLMKNKGFRYKQSIAQVRETIKRESDKLREFVEDCLIIDPNGQIPKHVMYETYVKFCTENKYDPYPQQKFSVNLPSYQINKAFLRIDGHPTRFWRATFNKENEWLRGQVKGLDSYV